MLVSAACGMRLHQQSDMIGTEEAGRCLESGSRIGWARPNRHQRAVVSANRLTAFVAPCEALNELSAKGALVIHVLPTLSSLCRAMRMSRAHLKSEAQPTRLRYHAVVIMDTTVAERAATLERTL